MTASNPLIHFNVPYVLICGSYHINRNNDKLCDFLGSELAKHNIGIISGGAKPGIRVAESLNRLLTDLDQYQSSKIITVYRKKNVAEEIKIKRIGSIFFEGRNIGEMRDYLFSISKIVIVIGGATKTREEVLLAQERNLSIIPVGMTGGTAHSIWLQYYKTERYKDEKLFSKLNNPNAFIASDAVVSILKDLISGD
jgi:predicted Rossmann-fold nucleotide-binding protein